MLLEKVIYRGFEHGRVVDDDFADLLGDTVPAELRRVIDESTMPS